jgi:choline monooxygenase
MVGAPVTATLPATWYADEAVLAAERERIFARAWQWVGRIDQLPQPGAFFAAEAGHVPVVVTRGRDDVLRAFVNVCRHRGHLVAEGEGCRGTLQCPYHAWTYDLDGRLRRAPRSEHEPDFDPAEWSLLPVAVDRWGPLVFVNPDPDAAPLAETLGELPDLLAGAGVDMGVLAFRRRVEWSQAANWKVGIENYLECYHCAVAHPGLSKVIDVAYGAYQLDAHPTFSVQRGPLKDGAAPWDTGGQVSRAQWQWLWPNLTINVEPGPQNLSVDLWLPDGAGRLRGVTDYFFGPDCADADAEAIIAFSQQTGAEDQGLVESVQRGLASGMVSHGRLLESSERLVAHFQRMVRDALA